MSRELGERRASVLSDGLATACWSCGRTTLLWLRGLLEVRCSNGCHARMYSFSLHDDV